MQRFLLGVAFVLLLSGCGAMRFNRAWSSFPAGGGAGMEGRWKGEWKSEWNGHSGGLRCLVRREDEGRYLAWFFSTYARVLFFQYETVFQVTAEEDGTLRFVGEQDLGEMVGGVYRYEGTVGGDLFHAIFRAENGDHGVFEMQRVE